MFFILLNTGKERGHSTTWMETGWLRNGAEIFPMERAFISTRMETGKKQDSRKSRAHSGALCLLHTRSFYPWKYVTRVWWIFLISCQTIWLKNTERKEELVKEYDGAVSWFSSIYPSSMAPYPDINYKYCTFLNLRQLGEHAGTVNTEPSLLKLINSDPPRCPH